MFSLDRSYFLRRLVRFRDLPKVFRVKLFNQYTKWVHWNGISESRSTQWVPVQVTLARVCASPLNMAIFCWKLVNFQGKRLIFWRNQAFFIKLRHFCDWKVSISLKNRPKTTKKQLILGWRANSRHSGSSVCILSTSVQKIRFLLR